MGEVPAQTNYNVRKIDIKVRKFHTIRLTSHTLLKARIQHSKPKRNRLFTFSTISKIVLFLVLNYSPISFLTGIGVFLATKRCYVMTLRDYKYSHPHIVVQISLKIMHLLSSIFLICRKNKLIGIFNS